MSKFYKGQKLKGIFWSNGEMLRVGDAVFDAKSITVVMENGQADGVPWALVEFNAGNCFKYNLALCEGVVLFKEGQATMSERTYIPTGTGLCGRADCGHEFVGTASDLRGKFCIECHGRSIEPIHDVGRVLLCPEEAAHD